MMEDALNTEAGRSIEGAIVRMQIPPTATVMRKTSAPTIHFVVGGPRCFMPVMIELKKGTRPNTLFDTEVVCEVSFDTHTAGRGRQIDVIRGKIAAEGEPNVVIQPEPKYRRIDLRPIKQH